MADKKKPIVAVVGPTASGKTKVAIEIAKKFNGEIISADSMQVYKGMNIATATPSEEEKQGVKHHLMSFLSPEEMFNVADYVDLAHDAAEKIYKKGKLPIIVGGTGLYIDSFLDNVDFFSFTVDENRKKELNDYAKKHGGAHLIKKLASVDNELAEKLHENQHDRIIRGILVYEATKRPLSELKKASKLKKTPYTCIFIGLNAENRQYLYDRINKRVDIMMENGLLEESKEYFGKNLSITAAAAIGHKELNGYLKDEIGLDEAIKNLKQSTRRYAKRQLTWFRKNKLINWLYIDKYKDYDSLIEAANDIMYRWWNEYETNS